MRTPLVLFISTCFYLGFPVDFTVVQLYIQAMLYKAVRDWCHGQIVIDFATKTECNISTTKCTHTHTHTHTHTECNISTTKCTHTHTHTHTHTLTHRHSHARTQTH